MTTDGSCREAVYFWHGIRDDTGIMFQQCFRSSLMLEKIHIPQWNEISWNGSYWEAVYL